jgi:hypothetical protein
LFPNTFPNALVEMYPMTMVDPDRVSPPDDPSKDIFPLSWLFLDTPLELGPDYIRHLQTNPTTFLLVASNLAIKIHRPGCGVAAG